MFPIALSALRASNSALGKFFTNKIVVYFCMIKMGNLVTLP